jgi:serine/threonine protein kinase
VKKNIKVNDTLDVSAVDVWSVGCILAELLTGKPLFPGTDRILFGYFSKVYQLNEAVAQRRLFFSFLCMTLLIVVWIWINLTWKLCPLWLMQQET